MRKYVKTFENYFLVDKSLNSKDLYNELLPFFEPKWNLERPSGHSLECIEMIFNNNTKFDDVKDIIRKFNWYVVKGDIESKIEIRPIYSTFYVENFSKIVYHISPSINDESIMKHGLESRSNKKKGINYPDRIYVVSDLKTLDVFKRELNLYVGVEDWTLWQIDLSQMKLDYLYVDETVNQNLLKPTAFYLQKINIPKEYLKVIERIKLK